MRYAYVLLAAIGLAACSSGGAGPTGNGSPAPSARSLSIPVGESRVVPGTTTTIAFLRVAEDSRCPLDVDCVWAGNGRVELRLSGGAADREVSLNTTEGSRDVEFAGLRIALEVLDPYPRTTTPTDPDDYVATFVVADD
jgi:hypothetical protein